MTEQIATQSGEADEDKMIPVQQKSEQESALDRGVERILDVYPSREHAQLYLIEEMRMLKKNTELLIDYVDKAEDIYDMHVTTVNIRNTLIENEYGIITQKMIANQMKWNEYMMRLELALEQAPTGLNWLSLILAECKSTERALELFWNLKEGVDTGAGTFDTRAYEEIVSELVLELIPRRNFLARRHNDDCPAYEAVFCESPEWLIWDVIPPNSA